MLKTYFKVQTEGTLRINHNGRKADDADTLASAGLKDEALPFELTDVMKVEELESTLAERGLSVDVAIPDDWVYVPGCMTLGQLYSLPKNATKAQLEALIGKPVIEMVRKDIENFMNKSQRILYNERDLQVRLAEHLRKSPFLYDSVDLEYLVPIKELINVNNDVSNPKLLDKQLYPWSNKASMWIDIVVGKDGYFVPIELKYTTAKIESGDPITRFGEPVISDDVQLVKNQAASNLVKYNYWKDVRRIELVKQRYAKIVGGIALIVTNSSIFWKNTDTEAAYKTFSTGEGVVVKKGEMKWAAKVSKTVLDGHPNFSIEGHYTCHWKSASIQGLNEDTGNSLFRYCLVEI